MNEKASFEVQLDDGHLSRHKTELLSDGSYRFEDELAVAGVFEYNVITCTAWLLELYELKEGTILFQSGNQKIGPISKRFGVFYPPFSVARTCFQNPKGRLIGIAGTEKLPPEPTTDTQVFDLSSVVSPCSAKEIANIISAGKNRLSVPNNPRPSALSLDAKKLMDENYLSYPSISRIAARLGVSHEHLTRQFKSNYGLSPIEYVRELRVADAQLRLARGEQIIDVSLDVGYNDLSRFYKQFRRTTTSSPGACKKLTRSRS